MNDFLDRFNDLSRHYLEALSLAEEKAVLSLFSPGAKVISPLYGVMPAKDFYALLFADTQESEVSLKDVMVNEQRRSGALFFHYIWTMANGEKVLFEVIDYVQLNEEDLIESLQIVYDTQHTRSVWNKQNEH